MAYDTHSLLAYSTVLGGGVVNSTSGTTLQVNSGDSSKFAINQNVTVWPSGVEPNLGTAGITRNAEIMRITTIDTQSDTFTVQRAQEGLTPALSNIAVGYQVANTITPKTLTDIEAELYNPYKFRVHRNAAQNTTTTAFAVVNFDTRDYDTSSNVDITTNKGRFTAPVAGFYQFNTWVGLNTASGTTVTQAAFYKNGSAYSYGSQFNASALGSVSSTVSDIIQLAANDFVEVYFFCNGTTAIFVGAQGAYFSGFLVSQT